jgi:ABC-2 type transport system permease protein
MFGAIFSFELKQAFRKPMTYIFFAIYILISMLIGLVATGVFNTAQSDSNTVLNSSYAFANILVGLNGNILGMMNSIILVSIMANAIQKDYEYNIHPFFFTKPISKAHYFFGRFLAAFVSGIFVMSGMLIGFSLGILPGIGSTQIGPWHWNALLEPMFIFLIPNVFILGVIFFSLTTFTRTTLAAYMTCIILLIGRFIAENLSGNPDYAYGAALWEPFGSNAYMHVTKYWTPAEQNTLSLPLDGVLLYNRLLWLGIALVVMIVSFVRFEFSQFLSPFVLFKRSKNAQKEILEYEEKPLSSILTAKQDYSAGFTWRQLIYLSKFEFKKIVTSTFYLISCALILVMIGVIYYYRSTIYDTENQALTEELIQIVGVYSALANIFVIFYAGTVIFRERESKTDELIHTTPVHNTVLYFSKFFGLLFSVVLMQLLAVVMGIGLQFSEGFYQINIGLYLIEIVLFGILSYVVTIGICLALQVLAPNKYLGFFFSLIPLMLLGIAFTMLQWTNGIYHFDSNGPRLPYSALNGMGPLGPYFLYRVYWIAFVLCLSLLGLFVYARGKEKGLRSRLIFSKKEVTGTSKLAIAGLFIVFLGAGAYIYYNTNILNQYVSPKELIKKQVAYELKYRPFANTLMPRIVAVDLDVDIYPELGNLHVKGYYWLKNKHEQALDTILVNIMDESSSFTYQNVSLAAAAKEFSNDSVYGIKLYKLAAPLAPGDSIKLSFEFNYKPKGFANNELSSIVVRNGTFFNNSIMPSLGYNEGYEVSSNKERKKFNLPNRASMRSIEDTSAYANTYISNDADWIRFETRVSTSPDQIAIAPGYLEREWVANGRKYYHYKMDHTILNFYAYQSAKYKVKKDSWKGISLEIYYDQAHEWNIDNMLLAMKHSLAYYTENFGPYQFRQLRIIEFPAFASFAQSFANTIPFSENVGFTNKVDTADWKKIDMPFYITAHEVAHQWWAHQVIGANVQGATLMSETMAQYAALMVMEHRYGKDNMKKFLKHEMDNYLRARTFEAKGEKPLMLVEQQSYIYYQKGSVIMYALKDYIGEANLNNALKKYIADVSFQEAPYTTSKQFVSYLKEATPDSLKYIITDFFETITVYENYVKNLKVEPLKDGKYKVNFTVGCVKFRVDSTGNDKKVPVNDYIDIGVFGKTKDKKQSEFNPLMLRKFKISADEQRFEFIVDEEPVYVGIDPYNKLIDRTPENNIAAFGTQPKIPSLSESGKRFIKIED